MHNIYNMQNLFFSKKMLRPSFQSDEMNVETTVESKQKSFFFINKLNIIVLCYTSELKHLKTWTEFKDLEKI